MPPEAATLCSQCGARVVRGALRCATCGTPFQGARAGRSLDVGVELEAGRIDDDTGELVTPGITFRVK